MCMVIRQKNMGIACEGKTGEHENMEIACGDKTEEHENMGIACEGEDRRT